MSKKRCGAEVAAITLQIRCGDLYADKAVEAFTACAVSDKKCVPQRVDESTFPQPPPTALDEKFDLNNFQVTPCSPQMRLQSLRLITRKLVLFACVLLGVSASDAQAGLFCANRP